MGSWENVRNYRAAFALAVFSSCVQHCLCDDGDDDDANNLWYLGVILGLLGSVAINTGNNLQSMGMQQLEMDAIDEQDKDPLFAVERVRRVMEDAERAEDDSDDEDIPPVDSCQSVTWKIGTVIFVSGSLLNFASYGFAAQSLLACLEAIQFVTNLAFGKFMLGTKVTMRQVLGTAVIVGGTILTVMFSSKDSLELGTKDILNLWEKTAFHVYLATEFVALIVLHYVHGYYQAMEDKKTPLPHSSVVLQGTYATWSALFGTMSVVQAKCLAELLAAQLDGREEIFLHWFTYVCLLSWLLLTSVWLYRMNEALSKYNPIFIIPLLQVNFIFFAIVSGGIFFEEFNTFTTSMWIGFWCGVCTIFVGLYLLVPQEDEEETIAQSFSLSEVERRTSLSISSGQGSSVGKGQALSRSVSHDGSMPHSATRFKRAASEEHRSQSEFRSQSETRRTSMAERVENLSMAQRRGSFLVLGSKEMGLTFTVPHTTSLASAATASRSRRASKFFQEARDDQLRAQLMQNRQRESSIAESEASSDTDVEDEERGVTPEAKETNVREGSQVKPMGVSLN